MARKRMIHPQIWEDPSFNRVSRNARLLFIGMISNADDEGYLRADSGSLKRLIFGFDDLLVSDLQQWVDELKTFSGLHFFENNGEIFAHFLKWDDYQKQQIDRIIESIYPRCSICLATDKQLLPEVKLSKVKLSKDKLEREKTPAQIAEEFFGNPEPIILELLARGLPEQNVRGEINNFISYWTEPNKSGTRQRWQTEKTFEIKRRLATWFNRSKEFNNSKTVFIP